jgi:hypothetical protein
MRTTHPNWGWPPCKFDFLIPITMSYCSECIARYSRPLTVDDDSLWPVMHNPHISGTLTNLSRNRIVQSICMERCIVKVRCKSVRYFACTDPNCPKTIIHQQYRTLTKTIFAVFEVWPQFFMHVDLILEFCGVLGSPSGIMSRFTGRKNVNQLCSSQDYMANPCGMSFILSRLLVFDSRGRVVWRVIDDTMLATYCESGVVTRPSIISPECQDVYMEFDPTGHRVWFNQTDWLCINPLNSIENWFDKDYKYNSQYDAWGDLYQRSAVTNTYAGNPIVVDNVVYVHIAQNIIHWHRSRWASIRQVDVTNALCPRPIWHIIGTYAFGPDFEHYIVSDVNVYRENAVKKTPCAFLTQFGPANIVYDMYF